MGEVRARGPKKETPLGPRPFGHFCTDILISDSYRGVSGSCRKTPLEPKLVEALDFSGLFSSVFGLRSSVFQLRSINSSVFFLSHENRHLFRSYPLHLIYRKFDLWACTEGLPNLALWQEKRVDTLQLKCKHPLFSRFNVGTVHSISGERSFVDGQTAICFSYDT